jgi:hypothetical protein
MGGNSVNNAEALKLVCEFHGAKVEGESEAMRAQLLELVRRRAGRGAVASASTGRLEVATHLDRQTIEALQLEIRRLARRHGTEVTQFTVERAGASV